MILTPLRGSIAQSNWLSLPYYSDHTELLDSTFLALHDWLSEIEFDDARVKKERGVIVEELRGYQQND